MKLAATILIAGLATAAALASPTVANIRASQRSGTKLVDVYYDLTDPSGAQQTVWINVSGDGGATWTIPASSISGAAGSGVVPAANLHLVWNAGQDWNGQYVPNCKVRVFANDGTTPIPPAGMAYIPPGPFQMGDNFAGIDAPSQHAPSRSGPTHADGGEQEPHQAIAGLAEAAVSVASW